MATSESLRDEIQVRLERHRARLQGYREALGHGRVVGAAPGDPRGERRLCVSVLPCLTALPLQQPGRRRHHHRGPWMRPAIVVIPLWAIIITNRSGV
jgi:hypothetical protein